MKDFVSSHWIGVVALIASLSVVCAIFVPYSLPWTGLRWASLALSAAVLLAMMSTGSLKQTIDNAESEAMSVVPIPERVPMPTGRAQLRMKGKGTL